MTNKKTKELDVSMEKPMLFYIYPSMLTNETKIDVNALTGMMQLTLENEKNTQNIMEVLAINARYNLPFTGDLKNVWKSHGKKMLEIASGKKDLFFPVIELFEDYWDESTLDELVAPIIQQGDLTFNLLNQKERWEKYGEEIWRECNDIKYLLVIAEYWNEVIGQEYIDELGERIYQEALLDPKINKKACEGILKDRWNETHKKVFNSIPIAKKLIGNNG